MRLHEGVFEVATRRTSRLRTYFSSQCSALSIHRFQSGTTYRNLIDAKADGNQHPGDEDQRGRSNGGGVGYAIHSMSSVTSVSIEYTVTFSSESTMVRLLLLSASSFIGLGSFWRELALLAGFLVD